MPKTEHAAPSAKELREAMKLAAACLSKIYGEEVEIRARLIRLASGPTLEERLLIEEDEAQRALSKASMSGSNADISQACSRFTAARSKRESHASKLSEEAGDE